MTTTTTTTTRPVDQYRQMARFLNHLRVSGRGIPVNAAEALLLIAAGVDHVSDLCLAMADHDGKPLPGPSCARLVALLRGRARKVGDSWVESPFALVNTRPHPHRKGLQLRLSKTGRLLVDTFFPGHDEP